MDIKYKNKEMEISIKGVNKNAFLNEQELNGIVRIIELFKNNTETITSSFAKTIEEIKSSDSVNNEKIININDERPIIRNRIPNEVDLTELEIKKATTETPMIRCPGCGQSSKTIVNIDDEAYYLRKDYVNGKEEFVIIANMLNDKEIDGICKKPDADIMDYHNDIAKIKIPKKYKNHDLNVNNNTLLECPICREKHKFLKWVDVFKHPVDYGFESDMLCDVCGHEAVTILKKDNLSEVKCEKCGYSKIISQ